MNTDKKRLFAKCLLAVVLTCGPLFGVTYSFTKIADNAPGSAVALSPFPGPFLVNSQGVVAFSAQYRDLKGDTVFAIYTSSGSGLTTVVEDSTRLILTGFKDSGTVGFIQSVFVYYAAAGVEP